MICLIKKVLIASQAVLVCSINQQVSVELRIQANQCTMTRIQPVFCQNLNSWTLISAQSSPQLNDFAEFSTWQVHWMKF